MSFISGKSFHFLQITSVIFVSALTHRQSTAKNGDIIVASVNRADCICRHFIKYKQNLVILRPDNRTYAEIDAGGTELKIFGRVTEIRRKL